MKFWLLVALLMALVAGPSAAVARRCSGHYWGGGEHTSSHGGTYIGGAGSSHKGGHYVGPYGGYGCHR
jgi:hypothetical protein